MKKVIISILAVIGVIFLFLGYRVFIALSFFKQSKSMNLDNYGRMMIKDDDNNFPDYLIDFYPKNDDLIRNIGQFDKKRPHKEKLYDQNENKVFASGAEVAFSNNINDFKNLVSVMKNKMKEQKKSVPPSIEESESFSAGPTFKTVRATAKYWFIMSRILEQKKDYEASLLTGLATLYLSKDLETNYINSGFLATKMICTSIIGIACDSMFVWASKPRPQCKELSKEVAKDILDFVKNDYPLSRNIEFECFIFDDMLRHFESKGSEVYAKLRKSSDYKYLLDTFYREPMKYCDKPLYELKEEIKKNTDNYNKLLSPEKSDYIYWFLFKPERLVSITLLSMSCPSFYTIKKAYEVSLAKMEMVAIALAINSYVCEKRKYPESMEELSKWFGQELPNNRLTNESYVLDFKGEHTLYNANYDESKKRNDEFYFNFSLK